MLSLHDTEVLRRNGFIQMEIEELNHWLAPDGSPQHIDLSTPGWQGAMKTRAKFMRKYRKGGANYKQYEDKIKSIYDKLKTTGEQDDTIGEQDDTIATFLRSEYSRVMVPKTDYAKARENRAMRIVDKAYKEKSKAKR
jgi:hypothetical protein